MQSIAPIPALYDNYIWLLRQGPNALIVDPGEAGPVIDRLKHDHLTLRGILITHHHLDHRDGVPELSARFSPRVFGPGKEGIPGVTDPLRGGETIHIAELDLSLQVMAIPGHTRDHLAYYDSGYLFCGDTLFCAGCGRLFEGTAAEMMSSLQKLASLPENTAVHCGHEYTENNLRFALMVEPQNAILRKWSEEVALLRAKGRCSLPTTIALERAINPFLRCSEPTVLEAVKRRKGNLQDPLSVFTALREWRDIF